MRLDYLTIFPAWFDVLSQSLTGRAAQQGLLDVHVHDLRDWTHDRHRTVDDAPFGGGAGMVMRPEPWGEALDALLTDAPSYAADGTGGTGVTVVVPTPAGHRFDQARAAELATRDRLVFACGRYEGIDQRVLDDLADRPGVELAEVSLGDYVLNGGEVAALAVTEAVARLLPGFVGNAASLEEESHQGGLLEYPVYTRPATWRGREVPAVLLSGDHARIATWRAERSRRRTAERRPDLLPPTELEDGFGVVPAVPADAGEILTLQLACWVSEALANDDLGIPALHEDLDTVRSDLATWTVGVVRSAGRLVGAVRGRLDGDVWHIGRLMVAPDLRGRGLGRLLLEHIEAVAPAEASSYSLFTGVRSESNLRRYRRAGYRVVSVGDGPSGPAVLVKPRASGHPRPISGD